MEAALRAAARASAGAEDRRELGGPLPAARRPVLRGLPFADHAVHADHRPGDQLEGEETTLLDPAGKLDVEREIPAESELIVVFGVPHEDDAAVSLHARLRHRVPH